MRPCLACGNLNPDGMSFCQQCGKPLGSPPADDISGQATIAISDLPPTQAIRPLVTASHHSVGSTNATPQAPERKSRTGLIIGTAVGVVLLVGIVGAALVGCYLYLERAQPSNSDAAIAKNASNNGNRSTNPTRENMFPPPVAATRSGTFVVHADDTWQISEIEVIPEEDFEIDTTGLVDIAGVRSSVGPDGIADAASKPRRLMSDRSTGALMMRIRYPDGRFSNSAAISDYFEGSTEKNERGHLEFCVNDNSPQNNGGQFTVTVTRVEDSKR